MIDTHYDLLTIAYLAYIKNDYSYLEKIVSYFHGNNVVGVIANLYFMSEEAMKVELSPKYYQEDISVLEMFIKAKEVLDSYLPNVDILYSIEGADYIKDCLELEKLYDAGLDAILVTWNTENKYASGIFGDARLTIEGKNFLRKAISLGIGIDLSHLNSQSFDDVVNLVLEEKSKGFDVCCYASHSNSKVLCSRKRNLEDYQLQKIKEIGGQVGVFAHRNFVLDPKIIKMSGQSVAEDIYLKHIEHIAAIIGKDNVMVASDDMDFCKGVDKEYSNTAIYEYKNIFACIHNTLSSKYNEVDCHNIMYSTAKEKIFNKIRKFRENRGVK